MADDEIKDLMRGLLLTLLDVQSNQVASERKHGYSIRLLRTERVAHAPLGKRLGSRQDNVVFEAAERPVWAALSGAACPLRARPLPLPAHEGFRHGTYWMLGRLAGTRLCIVLYCTRVKKLYLYLYLYRPCPL